jgi:hypothetical protein
LVSASCQGQQHSGRCLSCPAGPETPYREHELRASSWHDGLLLDVPSEARTRAKAQRPPRGEVCYPAPSKRRGISSNTASAARHFVEHSPAVGQKLPCQTCVSAARSSWLRTILRRGIGRTDLIKCAAAHDHFLSSRRLTGGTTADGDQGEWPRHQSWARSAKHGLLSTWPTQILGGCYTASARFCRNGR